MRRRFRAALDDGPRALLMLRVDAALFMLTGVSLGVTTGHFYPQAVASAFLVLVLCPFGAWDVYRVSRWEKRKLAEERAGVAVPADSTRGVT